MQYRMKNKTTSSLTQKLVGAYVVTPICLEALLQIAFLNWMHRICSVHKLISMCSMGTYRKVWNWILFEEEFRGTGALQLGSASPLKSRNLLSVKTAKIVALHSPSPTGYMLISFSALLIQGILYRFVLKGSWSLGLWTGYFSNSTSPFVTSSPISLFKKVEKIFFLNIDMSRSVQVDKPTYVWRSHIIKLNSSFL